MSGVSGGPAVTVVGQLADLPPIRYACNRNVHLAYQQWGAGDIDLVGIPPIAQNIEVAWEHPSFRRLFGGLGSFSRYLHFDKRGTGMSDRDAGIPSLDERVDDLRAVLDDAGVEQAFLCAVSEGGPVAIVFAATYPERVRGLVTYGIAPGRIGPDDPQAAPDPEAVALLEAWLAAWGTDQTLSPYGFTPSLAEDPDYLKWIARYERQSASPGDLRRLVALSDRIDVRWALPLVNVPTLVLHRRHDPITPLSDAVCVAEQIPNARLVVLEGRDHAPHGGDVDGLVAAIRSFVLGSGAAEPDPDRVLATVLFTDIVRSTERASELGDRRWREILDTHDTVAESLVRTSGGRVVKSTGDGLLAVFDGPARAVRCAQALRQVLQRLGLEQRAGLHAGEIDQRGRDVAGIAVHIAARIEALAGVGEILVTRTVRDLVVGSDLRFEARGRHALKGVADEWEVLAAVD